MTIPNILTLIRLGLMPVFVGVYFFPHPTAKWWAMGILALSFVTDILDGFIARRFNQVSDLGKILDPVADKLMQVTVLVCIAFMHKAVIWAVGFVFLKELLLGIGAWLLFSKGVKMQSSDFPGKVACFFSVLISMILLFPFPYDLASPAFGNFVVLMVWILVGFHAIAFANYILKFFKLAKKV